MTFSSYNLQLQTKLMLTLTVFVTLVVGPVGVYWYQNQQASAIAELEARAAQMANLLSKTLAGPLWSLDWTAARDQIDAVLVDPQVFSATVVVTNPSNVVISKKRDGPAVDGVQHKIEIVYAKDPPASGREAETMKLGTVEVVYSRDFMHQRLRHLRTLIESTIVFLLASLFAATYFTFRRMVQKPIGELVKMTGRIADGDFNISIPVTSGDEVGILAGKFNVMTAKLQQTMEGLSRSEEKYRAIFENSLEGIYQISLEGKMLNANPAMARILGFDSPDDLVNEVTDIRGQLYVHPEDRDSILAKILQQGMVLGQEFECYRKDKQIICISINARVVRDDAGCPLYIEGLATDITKRKWADEELRKHRNHLEELVADRTSELRVAKEKAEVANQAKSTFLAGMSHELRTPLNAILGYAQILKRDKRLSDRQTVGLSTIQQSGEHLLMLINDILDLSKIEAGKLELYPGPINLPIFLRLITDIIRVKAEQKSLLFAYSASPDLPKAVKGDEKRLRQVLLNLLGNAVKFTDRGQINLHVRRMPGSDVVARLHFEVQDTGIGMNREQVQAIFRPFEQVGAIERRPEGTGLGLAISRQLVRLMGGDIQVESEFGSGSRFWFDLSMPLRVELPSPPIERIISGYQGSRKKLLIVDDVVGNRAMLVDQLGALGFDIAEASNGHECMKQLATIRPDLILMDKMMPIMDGLETTRKVRQTAGFEHLPIITISASAAEEDRTQCLAAGADAFISKPIVHAHLLRAIGQQLRLSWLYDNGPKEQAIHSTENAQPPVAPPRQEIQVLYELALGGNMREIRQWATRVAAIDDRYRPFADKLQLMAKTYQSQAILEMVEEILQRNENDLGI